MFNETTLTTVYEPLLDPDSLPKPEEITTNDGNTAYVYSFGEQKIAFGLEQSEVDGVEVADRSPIGHEDLLGGGNPSEAAKNYAYALMGITEISRNSEGYIKIEHLGTEVDVLILYAEAGDETAAEQLKLLISKGKESHDLRAEEVRERQLEHLEEFKKSKLSDAKSFIQDIIEINSPREDNREFELQIAELNSIQTYEELIERYRDIVIDSLVLVHTTKYQPPRDESGQVTLYPTSEYGLTTDEGDTVDYPRSTLHFTFNHMVESHINGNWDGYEYMVVAPLADVLEANPMTIENTNEVDAYFCPEAFKPLVIKNAKVLEATNGETLKDQLTSYLAEQNKLLFKGGMHHATGTGQGSGELLANILGSKCGLHEGSPEKLVEDILATAIIDKENLDEHGTVSLIRSLVDIHVNEAARAVAWGVLGGKKRPPIAFMDDLI